MFQNVAFLNFIELYLLFYERKFMLEQPLNSTDTVINSSDSTTKTETVNTVPQITENQHIVATAQSLFNVPPAEIQLPQDTFHACVVSPAGVTLSSTRGGDLDLTLENITLQPVNISVYYRLKVPGRDANEGTVKAFNGYVEEEGNRIPQDEYLNRVKKDFPEASWEERGALFTRFKSAEPLKSGVAVPLTSSDFVMVYLSPSSLKAWKSFIFLAELNKDTVEAKNKTCVQLTKRDKKGKSFSWVHFDFTAVEDPAEQSPLAA